MSEPTGTSRIARTYFTHQLWWAFLTACTSQVPDPAVMAGPTPRDASHASAQSADASHRAPVASVVAADAGARPTSSAATRDGASRADSADDGCGGASYVAQARALEVLVLFDNSTSMILPAIRPSGELVSLWDVAVMELQRFCSDPRSEGISLALKYFGTECNADFYSTPDVPMGALPEHGAAVAASLANTLPLAETATRPALQGALQYMQKRAGAAGNSARQVILLVTDGYPDEADCPDNSTHAVSAVAAQGFAAPSSIATYAFVTVTGILLDEIASAGGTGKTVLADLGKPGALADALASVRDQELSLLPCTYDLPPAYFSDVNDPGLVNLIQDGVAVPHVGAQSDCREGTHGWYYDDAEQPRQIATCAATCAGLKTALEVEVQLSCPTVLI